jgi:hypothetical protein
LLALAYTAHVLPVVWGVGLLAYAAIARRLRGRGQAALAAAAVAGMLALHAGLRHFTYANWRREQLSMVLGVDQAWLYDGKYGLAMAGLLLAQGILLLRLVRQRGPRALAGSVALQAAFVASAALVALPHVALLPPYSNPMSYIPDRLSLGAAICCCAVLGGAKPGRLERLTPLAAAALFFGFAWRDDAALNAFERRMEQAIAGVPSGARVISVIDDYTLKTRPVAHTLDRVAIGRCFSYANYEPSTGQFRVRATGRNGIVAGRFEDSIALQIGNYVVGEADLPLYAVDSDRSGNLFVRPLGAGERVGKTLRQVLEDGRGL